MAFAGGNGGNKNNKGKGFVFGSPFPQETYLLPSADGGIEVFQSLKLIQKLDGKKTLKLMNSA
jgi:hypothetical protein